MRIILDTHTALWYLNEYEKLSEKALDLLLNDEYEQYLSIASLWEVAIKVSLGKLTELSGGVAELIAQIDETPIEILPLTPQHVGVIETLPFIH